MQFVTLVDVVFLIIAVILLVYLLRIYYRDFYERMEFVKFYFDSIIDNCDDDIKEEYHKKFK